MASIFTKIINKEIPAFIIAEDDDFIAFLDIMPLAIGHTLVVPKKEVDYIFDCDDDVLSKMLIFSKKVAKKVESAIPCKRIGVAVIGLEVPHTHVHLVPLNRVGDINFERPKLSISKEELQAIAEKINLG
jgi:histidine triad (HIT) family protein